MTVLQDSVAETRKQIAPKDTDGKVSWRAHYVFPGVGLPSLGMHSGSV
jgi:hypothetical protein